jgi:molybdate transport system ATP-binding protein
VALELVNLTKKFGRGFKLGPLDLKISDNEILVIVGPTGSGKTTLLNLIAGFVKPDQGSIIADGLDMTNIPVESRRIGYTFQHPSLFPHLTVYDNVVYGLDKKSKKERKMQVLKLMDDLSITHLIDRHIQGLSGGEMQKVALARMLATRPKIMLMDEPLAQLDNPSKMKLRLELRKVLKNQGVLTIYVTHFEDDVYSLADSVSILQHGNIRYTGKLRSLLTHPTTSSSPFLSNVFTGGNYLEGKVVRSNAGITFFKIGSHLLETLGSYSVGIKVGILLRPEDIILSKGSVKTSARNIVKVRIIRIIPNQVNPSLVYVNMLLDGFNIIAKITEESRIELGIKEDDYVFAMFKASSPQVVREEY